ncbi:MAG: class I adenylate-forming enzyme family protein [Acidimicrobiia bacterium]
MTAQVTDPITWWSNEIGDEAAIVIGDVSVSYRELDGWVSRVAARYEGAGIEVGDRVGVIGPNSVEWCVAALGAIRAGASLVPLNMRLTPDELADLVAGSTPTLVMADDASAGAMKDVAGRRHPFELLDLAPFVNDVRHGPDTPFRRHVDPAQPAVIVYTSGTTAKPKGVIFSHATTLNFIFEWSLVEPDFTKGMRLLMVLPIHGAPGTLWGLIHTLVHGGTFFLMAGFEPSAAVRALAEHKITVFLGVPLLYEAMAATPEFAEADLSALRTTHVGGARVSVSLLKRWQEKGVLLRQIYGLTEGGGSITVNPREFALDKPEMCGRGGAFTRFKTVRPDGTACEAGEEGEILISGPAVTPGYWNNPEATRDAFVDGWLRTGDIGVIDEDGLLRMVDRRKDMIISGGINIAPAEIESLIAGLDEVEEVAVIPVPDEKFGETPAAVVKLRSPLPAEVLVAHCNKHLADYKVPRYVVEVSEPLPRMASGKVAKRIIKEQHPDIPATYPKVR